MFVEFEEVESWYAVALDGLRHLETALHVQKKRRISESTFDQIQGMSPNEWNDFLDEKELEHEMFASLAVLASFEGHIRRDAHWRGNVNKGQDHFANFNAIAGQTHIPISKIFELWEGCFSQGHHLRKQFSVLRKLYADRNIIAHGRAERGQFAFELIFGKLDEALRKWREFVPDFAKYS